MDAHAPRFSGALGRAAIVLPLALLIAVPALSALYAWVDVHCPVRGWFTWLFVVAFGSGLGWSVAEAGRLGHCRSPAFLRFMGTVAGVAGVYMSWAWFEYALLSSVGAADELAATDFLWHPAAMWTLATEIADTGWYSINSLTPSGGVLWCFWIAEAVLVVWFSVRLASGALDELVYCERCDRWCEPDGEPRRLAVPGGPARTRARAGDVDAIVALAAEPPDASDHVLLDLLRCARCAETGAFRLRRQKLAADGEERRAGPMEAVIGFVAGRGKRSDWYDEVVLDYTRCDAAGFERLRAIGGRAEP